MRGLCGLRLNDVNFQIFPLFEDPILLQPIFLNNLRTVIQLDATYVIGTLSLAHKGNFSIVLPRRSEFLSTELLLPIRVRLLFTAKKTLY